ncbi:uncharacterized protein LOC142239526 [Haematobia irritans]|uniref:uncharacterized protein LOC142239526 n=1 Tax=Haematobia irritans TaxID=7368 RepID=UPI003F50723E
MGVTLNIQNITCISHDLNFTEFRDCSLTLNNKKVPILNLTAKLLQLPVRDCLVHLEIVSVGQSNNQLRIYQGDWDACAFLQNRQRFKFLEMIHETIFAYTNINHTCPYNHDLKITNFPAGKLRAPLPVPIGIYKLITQYTIDKIIRYEVWFEFKAI